MAQSVKHPTLDFSSGRDLTARGFEPLIWLCADSAEPAWNSLSLSLSLPLPHLHTHSLSLSNKKSRTLNRLRHPPNSCSYIGILVLKEPLRLLEDDTSVILSSVIQ